MRTSAQVLSSEALASFEKKNKKFKGNGTTEDLEAVEIFSNPSRAVSQKKALDQTSIRTRSTTFSELVQIKKRGNGSTAPSQQAGNPLVSYNNG